MSLLTQFTDALNTYSILDETTRTVMLAIYNNTAVINAILGPVSNGGKTYKVTAIGDNAFYNVKGTLVSVNAPDVLAVGKNAFEDCIILETVEMNKVTTIGQRAFQNCQILQTVSMPQLVHIGTRAFSSAISAISISGIALNFPNVKYIDNEAFTQCSKLVAINLPKVIRIGESSFNSSGLRAINFPELVVAGNIVFRANNNLQTACLPKLKYVSFRMFGECSNLTKVSVPSATEIQDYAFNNCTDLVHVLIPEVEEIKTEAFINCTSLSNINLPKVKSVGNRSFNNTGLIKLKAPELQYIGDQAFNNIPSLISIDIPNVEFIGMEAFVGTGLTDVKLPRSLEQLGQYSFSSNIDTLTCIEVCSSPCTSVGVGALLNGVTNTSANLITVTTLNTITDDVLLDNNLYKSPLTNFCIKNKCDKRRYAKHFGVFTTIISDEKCNKICESSKSCCKSCDKKEREREREREREIDNICSCRDKNNRYRDCCHSRNN
uniref:Surface antigen BspA-like n=1 Tax=viral metagenome TaxID=1070528 RepID=A0A6C0BEN2_9ZZZZ